MGHAFARRLAPAALVVLGAALASSAPPAQAAKPNIIIVLADDLGGRELGCYGNSFNETPRLDKMAVEGMKFTSAYSAAPVCSPSRASIMTGEVPARTGITDFLEDRDDQFLDPDKFTALPKILKAAGYHTGMMGKWHLRGDYREARATPQMHGFDEAILTETSYIGGGDYRFPYAHIAGAAQRLFPAEDLTQRLNLEALDFIERNKDRPFFLYLSHYAVHTTLDAPDSMVAHFNSKRATPGDKNSKENNPVLGAMLKFIDDGVGQIQDKLKALGIEDNTLLIFTSDNGGSEEVTDNLELRSGKAHLYEGGIRIPFIARWPGQVPAGKVCAKPISFPDFYPTLTALAGGTLPKGQAMDGVSIEPLLRGTGDIAPRDLIWHYPEAVDDTGNPKSASAMLTADGMKLIRFYDSDKIEMYKLDGDISEEHDLAPAGAAQARGLADRLFARINRCQRGYEFKDDFNDKDMADWTVFGGTWAAAGGALNVNAGDGFRLVTDDRYFSDLVYQARITVGASGNAGIILRAGEDKVGRFAYHGYLASISAANGQVALAKVANGTPTDLGAKDAGIAAGTPYLLRVTARGGKLQVFVNDTTKALITVNDPAFDGGLIGLRSMQTAATFDDVYARGLAADSGGVPVTFRAIPAVGRAQPLRMRGTLLFSQGPRLLDARGREHTLEVKP